MYKDRLPLNSYRQVRNGDIVWFEAYQVGEQYALTWRDTNDNGGWLAWRKDLNEVLQLVPTDSVRVV